MSDRRRGTSANYFRGRLTRESEDGRWTHALDGLPCVVARVGEPGVLAEITGVDGFYVWVVRDGGEEPEPWFWTDVRPCAPLYQENSDA